MEVVRTGATRHVILTKRYAFKIPRLNYGWRMFLRGLMANMSEADAWSMRLRFLCPIVYAAPGGFLNVMVRAQPITEEDFRRRPCTRDWPVESKLDSWGTIGGKIVAVDYGEYVK